MCVVGPDLVAGAEIRFLPVIQPLALIVPAGDNWGDISVLSLMVLTLNVLNLRVWHCHSFPCV